MDRAGAWVFCQAPSVRSCRRLIQRRYRVWPVYLPYPAETHAALKQKLVCPRHDGLRRMRVRMSDPVESALERLRLSAIAAQLATTAWPTIRLKRSMRPMISHAGGGLVITKLLARSIAKSNILSV